MHLVVLFIGLNMKPYCRTYLWPKKVRNFEYENWCGTGLSNRDCGNTNEDMACHYDNRGEFPAMPQKSYHSKFCMNTTKHLDNGIW